MSARHLLRFTSFHILPKSRRVLAMPQPASEWSVWPPQRIAATPVGAQAATARSPYLFLSEVTMRFKR